MMITVPCPRKRAVLALRTVSGKGTGGGGGAAKSKKEAKTKMRDEEDDASEEFPEAPTLRETGSCVSA